MQELNITYMPVEALEPYTGNSRAHGVEDVEAIKKSIEKYGFNDPIGIWSDHNVIVEGHGRLQAAVSLGIKKVPCIRLDHLTDDQRREYAIMHNKTAELSTWDFEALKKELEALSMEGFEGLFSEAQELMDDDIEVEEDEAPEPPEEPTSKFGQMYRLGRHRLLVGDATKEEDVKRLAGGGVADLLLTDPPYNVDYTNKSIWLMNSGLDRTSEEMKKKRAAQTIINDVMNDDQYKDFLTDAFGNAKEIMRNGAAFYIWHAGTMAGSVSAAMKETFGEIRQTLIWVKNHIVFGRQDYKWQHEHCVYGWKDGAAHYFTDDMTQATVFEDKGIDYKKLKKQELLDIIEKLTAEKESTTVLHEASPQSAGDHPTMKPVKLMARLIKNSTRQGETVLDVFGGSGTTLIACEQLNRTCWMMELDPHYADVIIARWEKLTGEKAGLVEK